MSGKPAEQDPSIEEILASIRQIITDDDPNKASEAEPTAPAVVPVANDATVSAAAPAAEDVFELVDRVVAEEEERFAPSPAPEPEPAADPFDFGPTPASVPVMEQPVVEATPSVEETPIFSDVATSATLGAFSKLSETVTLERRRAIAGSTVTLEDIVRELLQPILRQWVDQHMPTIAERLVREELEKISRSAREG